MSSLNIKNIYAWPLTTRCLIIGLICLVVFYLVYSYEIAPLKSQLETAHTKEADLKSQLVLVIDKQMSVKKDLTQYSQYDSLLTEWKSKLVPYNAIPELLNTILKTGATGHISFAQFNPGVSEPAGLYSMLPIRVIAVGSYHHLADFMSQVANMEWIVTFGNFNFSNENKTDVLGSKLATEAGAENLLTAELTLQIYHIPDVKPVVPEVKQDEKK